MLRYRKRRELVAIEIWKEELSDRIKRRLHDINSDVASLIDDAHIDSNTLYSIINCETIAKKEILMRIANFLNMDFDELVDNNAYREDEFRKLNRHSSDYEILAIEIWKEELSDRIRKRLYEFNANEYLLSEASLVPVSTIRKIINCTSIPKTDVLEDIAEALDMSFDELVGNDKIRR